MNEQLTITLPEELKEFVDDEVSQGRFPSRSAYIENLIKLVMQQKTFERVEMLIQEGIDSGEPTPWTKDTLDELRLELRERRKHGNGNN